jgi:hypothetical protein
MIFQIFKIRSMARDAKTDPGGFVGGGVADAFVGMLITPLIVAIGVLVLLFLLSFTTVLGGPFGLAKFFFFVVLFGTYMLFSIIRKLSRVAKKVTKQAVDKTIKVTAEVIE